MLADRSVFVWAGACEAVSAIKKNARPVDQLTGRNAGRAFIRNCLSPGGAADDSPGREAGVRCCTESQAPEGRQIISAAPAGLGWHGGLDSPASRPGLRSAAPPGQIHLSPIIHPKNLMI